MKTSAASKSPAMPAPEGLDPETSVWVSASAGSGKTTLLVKRVLRLLLEGGGLPRRRVPRILCLTYTRAAAAEMQNRIQKTLASWAVANDDALREDLAKQFNLAADKERLKFARRLFGQVLEHPERVRVATLHGFCQIILNRFPLEAGVPPHFSLLEGDRLHTFQSRFLQGFFSDMHHVSGLQAAFDTLANTTGPSRLHDMVEEIFSNPQGWEKFFSRFPSRALYEQALRAHLGLPLGLDEKTLLAMALQPPALDEMALKSICGILSRASKTEQEFAQKIPAWLETSARDFEVYAAAFLTQKFTPRKNLPTKETRKKYPDIADRIDAELARVHALMQQVQAVRFLARQSAWHALFSALWQRLGRQKEAEAVLTYDDLILRTRGLLENPGVCAWVLYKLDNGIDHLLVDEAQDTSPAQWDILFSLLEEFLSGLGSRDDANRTIFVVGDEKQSIYSFQGADRARYLEARDKLLARLKAAGRKAEEVELKRSRRTPKAILDFVDAVFAHDTARAGVAHHIAHESARLGEPAYVELWPPVLAETPPPPAPWAAPLKREESTPAPVQLAENIASAIRAWLDEKWHLAAEKRAVSAGDILILLQRRSQLLLPIVRALKDNHVPVAGIDRMVITQAPAVQDVISLCRFLLLPDDSLGLAEVLRGPFIRISDEQLFALAYNRGEASLRIRLWAAAEKEGVFLPAVDYLKKLLAEVDFVTPFALLNEILFSPCPGDAISGQHALVTRLGPDAIDPLHELLSAALVLETQEAPSLQLFVQAILRSGKESKRELTKAGGEVRILTVHSAKGMEAPIVIIPDLSRNPARQGGHPALYWNDDGLPLSAGDDSKALLETAKENAKRAQEEENRRLLYVALTRPREALFLCGLGDADKKEEPPWYQFCRAGMERLAAQQEDGGILRYGDTAAFMSPVKLEETRLEAAAALPEWARTPLAGGVERPRIINPSQVAAKDEKMLPPSMQQALYRRGQLLHRLLQMLPMAEKGVREKLAFEFLRHHQPQKTSAIIRAETAEVMHVLNHADFAAVFAQNSRAEVPVIGYVDGKRIAGQIDRLAVTENEVLIIDFKTNRPPPDDVAGIAKPYLAQMAAYRALLEKIYPAHTVRCALLWTHTLRLMELSDALYVEGRTILKGA